MGPFMPRSWLGAWFAATIPVVILRGQRDGSIGFGYIIIAEAKPEEKTAGTANALCRYLCGKEIAVSLGNCGSAVAAGAEVSPERRCLEGRRHAEGQTRGNGAGREAPSR